MLEISAVSALDNVKIKLKPYQLIVHHNDNTISSEIVFDKKLTLEKGHFFITILSISLYKQLALIVDEWSAYLNSAFCGKFYIKTQPLLKKEEFTFHYYP
ncbi:hypothetical protein MTZ49_08805 [Entomomonas sp. E2T0]|uniref:hypothetical protein n=1 Tax=Entomomonas sp. E2T0 TaxID=2930213 RepID=UPI00222822B7|nr:hypothetical protein [Entomomonas sp. E2T0]UYZ82715.1 hypothetical protein MTZ49_08805 [Entomomonas sp. E2T0]